MLINLVELLQQFDVELAWLELKPTGLSTLG
jgi:hypothetical protein